MSQGFSFYCQRCSYKYTVNLAFDTHQPYGNKADVVRLHNCACDLRLSTAEYVDSLPFPPKLATLPTLSNYNVAQIVITASPERRIWIVTSLEILAPNLAPPHLAYAPSLVAKTQVKMTWGDETVTHDATIPDHRIFNVHHGLSGENHLRWAIYRTVVNSPELASIGFDAVYKGLLTGQGD